MKKKPVKNEDANVSPGDMQDEVVIRFLHVLEQLKNEGLTCDEMYARLDEYVEREVASHDASKIMPLIHEHIDICPECCEEYQALLAILEQTRE